MLFFVLPIFQTPSSDMVEIRILPSGTDAQVLKSEEKWLTFESIWATDEEYIQNPTGCVLREAENDKVLLLFDDGAAVQVDTQKEPGYNENS